MNKQLILATVFSIIIFGSGFPNSAFAGPGDPIPGVGVGLEGEEGLAGDPIPGVEVGLEGEDESITASDLGVDSVGTLPTSPFYFLKEWKRGVTRLFTFDSVAKAELELKITNQIAAEVLEVSKANPDDAGALKKALENFTDAQERLNMRIGKLPAISNPNVEKLLEEVDERTVKHIDLLEQLTVRKAGKENQEYLQIFDEALNNTLKTFTITVTHVNDASSLKQKAEEQIKRAGIAIDEAGGHKTTITKDEHGIEPAGYAIKEQGVRKAVPKQTQGATFGEKSKANQPIITKDVDNIATELGIFDRWGKAIAKAKSHLADAKTAFADGKYGEAYGLARSAEAIASGVRVAVGDINGDGRADKTAPAAPAVTPKRPSKINDNESPRPSDRAEVAPTTIPTLEKKETPQPAETKSTTSASTSDSDSARSPQATPTPTKNPMGTGEIGQ